MESPGEPDPNLVRPGAVTRLAPVDPHLQRLTAALRRVQDSATGVQAPPDVLAEAVTHLDQAAALLQQHALGPDDAPGWADVGRAAGGRALSPLVDEVAADRDTISGTVTFSNFYRGGNGAVHGGSVTLLFDELLGKLANTDRQLCRTAYLRVDFRRPTPVGRPLRAETRVVREEGRKHFLYGALYDGEELTAEADGLWVQLREGAP